MRYSILLVLLVVGCTEDAPAPKKKVGKAPGVVKVRPEPPPPTAEPIIEGIPLSQYKVHENPDGMKWIITPSGHFLVLDLFLADTSKVKSTWKAKK